MFALITMALATAPAPADPWQTYTNVRFGFSICYPSARFRPGPEPANGDGLAFGARDGAAFTVSGINDALDQGLPGQRANEEADHPGTITYRSAGSNWFVISGVERGRVFYTKTFFREGQFVSLRMTYPRTLARTYDPIVRRMQACFRPGKPAF